jgi:hypothetical protein
MPDLADVLEETLEQLPTGFRMLAFPPPEEDDHLH